MNTTHITMTAQRPVVHRGLAVLTAVLALTITSIPALAQDATAPSPTPAPTATAPVAKAPEGDAKLSFYGQVRPRFELRTDRDFGLGPGELAKGAPGAADLFTLRSRVGLKASKGALKLHILLQHVAIMGATGGDALTQPGGSVALASAEYGFTEHLALEMGRFYLAYGDERVLGAVGWAQPTRSWDGLRLKYEQAKKVKVHGFVTRHADGLADGTSMNPDAGLDRDGFLFGTYVTLLGVPGLKELDVYALGDILLDDEKSDNAHQRDLYTLGARLKGKWGAVDAVGEGAFQLGSLCVRDMGGQCTEDKNDVMAYFVDLEGGFSIDASVKPRLFLGFSLASGDDPDTEKFEGYNHLYPTAHKFLGRTDVVGPRSNVMEVRGGATFKFGERVSLRESVHYFQRMQAESERLGIEADTTLNVKAAKGAVFGFGHGVFLPGPAVSVGDAEPKQPHHWLYLQFTGSI